MLLAIKSLFGMCMKDLQSIKSDLATFCNNFLNSDPSSRSVDQLWEEFKEVAS